MQHQQIDQLVSSSPTTHIYFDGSLYVCPDGTTIASSIDQLHAIDEEDGPRAYASRTLGPNKDGSTIVVFVVEPGMNECSYCHQRAMAQFDEAIQDLQLWSVFIRKSLRDRTPGLLIGRARTIPTGA